MGHMQTAKTAKMRMFAQPDRSHMHCVRVISKILSAPPRLHKTLQATTREFCTPPWWICLANPPP
eukprot:5644914-Amphidinium_carterae.1